jgi:hypothetical protein
VILTKKINAKQYQQSQKKRGLKINFIEDTVSSGKSFEQRQISTLIEQARKDDLILVAELSRFASLLFAVPIEANDCYHVLLELQREIHT